MEIEMRKKEWWLGKNYIKSKQTFPPIKDGKLSGPNIDSF